VDDPVRPPRIVLALSAWSEPELRAVPLPVVIGLSCGGGCVPNAASPSLSVDPSSMAQAIGIFNH
jgi:hypothetical protein